MPFVVHAVPLELMHKVTQTLRLTASLRARKTLPENSLLRFVILLRTMKSRMDGAARLASTAATANVTSSSMSVNPR